jgi:hypothetical protein
MCNHHDTRCSFCSLRDVLMRNAAADTEKVCNVCPLIRWEKLHVRVLAGKDFAVIEWKLIDGDNGGSLGTCSKAIHNLHFSSGE